MTEQERYMESIRFLKDYQTYLHDHHITNDTITGITCEEARNLLRYFVVHTPHNLAKALAIAHPLDADRFDEVEHRVQDQMLPFNEPSDDDQRVMG